MLVATHLDGYVVDKIKNAINRLQSFEPTEGYYLAFSGGKDSQVIYHLAKEAGVNFDAHYNLTTVDPPELVSFIKSNYPDVIIHYPQKSMWKLIESKGLPTRMSRFCCEVLKEHGGEGRICVTGVRWAESSKRKNNRNAFEIVTTKKSDKILFSDNDNDRRMFENCMQKGKRIVNPIIDWLDEDVWEFLNSRSIEHCNLYDLGQKRLGCIGCPLNSTQQANDLKIYPKYYDNYLRAVNRFLIGYLDRCEKRNAAPFRSTAKEWLDWWIYEQHGKKIPL